MFLQTLDMIIHTEQTEKDSNVGTSYWDCFKGTNLRRTEIGTGLWLSLITSGNAFQSYGVVFFEQCGVPTSAAFGLNIAFYGIGIAGTIICWFLMTYIGRRKILLWGIGAVCVDFLIMGFVSLAPSTNTAVPWVAAVLLVLSNFFYDLSQGPLVYTCSAEGPASSLRSKTVNLTRLSFKALNIAFQVALPFQLGTTEGNWKGKIGFFFGGMSIFTFTWAYFRIPEYKGRTYEELDWLFENKISARKFARTEVNLFGIEPQYPMLRNPPAT